MKVLVRKVLYGNGTLMLQRRRYFLCIPFLYWWSDWKTLNNELHKKDLSIVSQVDKLQKMLDDRNDIEELLEREKEELNGRHQSETFYVKSDEFWFRRHPVLTPVDGKWRSLLNPKLFKKGTSGVQASIRDKMGIPDKPNRGGRSAYTLEDLGNFKIALEDVENYDNLITFKDPEKGQKKGKSERSKRPDETAQEHQARLKRLDSQKSDDY